MNIYQIKGNLKDFKALELNGLDIAEQLDQLENLEVLCNFSAKNISLKDNWGKVSSTFYAESPSATKLPSIMVWAGAALVLTKTAYIKLRKYIEHEGEFLIVDIEGNPYYIFNCLQYGKENNEQTLAKYIDGEAVGLENLEFDEQDVSSRLLFKSEKQGSSILYCTANFKALCNEFSLKGVIFDDDLLSPFI